MSATENDYFTGSFATSSPRSSALPRYDETNQSPVPMPTGYGNSAILIVVVFLIAIAASITMGIILFFSRQRKLENVEYKATAEDRTEASDASIAADMVDHALIVTEWKPAKRRICKGRPIGIESETIDLGSTSIESKRPNFVTTLFEESRGFGTFVGTDDTCSMGSHDEEDDDLDGIIGHSVDLVRAGVFKRTFELMKTQSRCVLCSVCYEVGDKVSVSNNPTCDHQYHQACILRWLKRKSVLCPVCKEPYIEQHCGLGVANRIESSILL
ncbi:expressed unknown protein [Seminavis robusta]|uniref:RING-type domain-containing protein n=1 Tax=Seminavis robusta TaxID=568900 RepID=A0A9N8DGE8_9STRA|nr:expressed unknown protein [Seminavis robusta]|eukprot:Sro78_g042410.1 n/a (271) ;mRNA; f:52773-53753